MLLSSVVTDICSRAGIGSSLIDVTELTDDVVGFTIPRQIPARTALETLMTAYQFDAVEQDWKLYFKKRGSTSIQAITATELRAHHASEQIPDRAVEVRTQDLEIPTHFTLSYESKVRDYEIASQNAVRVDKATYLPKNGSLGLVMTDSHAKQTAEIILKQFWVNRHRYTFSTTYKHLKLAPGDVITVSGKLMRITEMADRDGVVDFVCESEEGGVYTNAAVADDLTIDAIDLTESEYIPAFIAMDIPPIDDDFGNAGLTVAMYGASGYSGGTLQRSLDGAVFSNVGFYPAASAVVGTVTNALSSGISGIIDNSTTLTVNFSTSNGVVGTIATTSLWAGGNLAAIGTPANGWELVQFLTATSSTGYTYNITGFLRGLRGTNQFRATHTTSDKFVLLTTTAGVLHSAVDFIGSVLADIDVTYLFRAVNPSGIAGDSTGITIGQKTLDPYPPQVAFGSRNSSNDIDLNWYRGDRYEFTLADLSTLDTIQSEESVNYSVDVIHPVSSAVLRTVATTASTWTYTAAMQTSDSYPQTHPILFDIYQTSTVTSTRGPGLRVSI